MNDREMIEAAAAHWPALATLAWTSSQASGPGAVVIHRADLALADPAMHWFAARDVPKADDFRTLMLQYDAHRQVVVIIVDEHGDKALVLEADGDRPSPETCAQVRAKAKHQND